MEILENKPTAMVVDDDPEILETVWSFLRRLGYQADCFTESGEALGRLKAGNFPDVLLTDLYMPTFSGLDVLKEAHLRRREIPVIIMTGTRDFFSTVNALNEGAFGCLLKPVLMEEMQSILARVNREHQLRRDLAEEYRKRVDAQRKAELAILAAGVAHEINNPNTTILGNAEFGVKVWSHLEPLLKSLNGAEREGPVALARQEMPKLLNAIVAGAGQISTIVKAMSVSGPGFGDAAPFCDFRAGLEMAKQALHKTLHGIRVVTEDAVPGLVLVQAPEEPWGQIMVNLLSFAAHSLARQGRKNPTIFLRLDPADEKTLQVSVTDNGIPLAQTVIDRIALEKGGPQADGEEGALGLFITKILVHRLGGHFSVERNGPKGTTTLVRFPFAA